MYIMFHRLKRFDEDQLLASNVEHTYLFPFNGVRSLLFEAQINPFLMEIVTLNESIARSNRTCSCSSWLPYITFVNRIFSLQIILALHGTSSDCFGSESATDLILSQSNLSWKTGWLMRVKAGFSTG